MASKTKSRDLEIPNVPQVTSNLRRALEADFEALGPDRMVEAGKCFTKLATLEMQGSEEGQAQGEAELELQCELLSDVYSAIARYARSASKGFAER